MPCGITFAGELPPECAGHLWEQALPPQHPVLSTILSEGDSPDSQSGPEHSGEMKDREKGEQLKGGKYTQHSENNVGDEVLEVVLP